MLHRLLALSLSLAAVTLCGGIARASAWMQVRSAHFTVVGDASETDLRGAASRLELTRTAVTEVLPFLAADRGRDLTVIVFAEPAEYRAFKPLRSDGSADDAVLGFYLAGEDDDLITASSGINANLETSLSHEYVHYLLRSNYQALKLPPWLDEGLAEYFANLQFGPDGAVVVGSSRLERVSALRTGPIVDSSIFVSANPSMLKGGDQERGRFYSQAWAAVHFLLSRESSAGKLEQLLAEVANGSSSDTALFKAYGLDASKLVTASGEYISGSVPSNTIARIAVGRSSTASPLSNAEADVKLGELLMQMGREVDAETYLRRSTAADTKLGPAHTSLGMLLARKGNFAESVAQLETARSLGEVGVAVDFYYAYALSKGGQIGSMDDRSLDNMRAALQRALSLRPEHVPSMQLLAGLDLNTENNLPEAESLLKKASGLRPRDEQVQLMLAKVLLRRERYGDASLLAGKLATSTDAQVRIDAQEILNVSAEYRKTSIDMPLKPPAGMPWEQSIVFLKRSWLTLDELSAIEADRNNSNLNVALGPAGGGEQRVLGVISKVTCSGTQINYEVLAGGGAMVFSSSGFDRVRMSVLLEGSHTFRLDCGVDLSKDLAVLTYVPGKASRSIPVLRAIAFVPGDFRLLTPREVMSRRMLVVEDDRLRRDADGTFTRAPDLKPGERAASIYAALRQPAKDEKQIQGTITRLECGTGRYQLAVDAGGYPMRFVTEATDRVKVRWFTPETAQSILLCDGDLSISHALVTYAPREEGLGELRAIEMLPAWLRLPDSPR